MIRFIIIALAILGAIWCYNNIDFSKTVKNMESSAQNAKIIKTVNNTRTSNYEAEQDAINNQ